MADLFTILLLLQLDATDTDKESPVLL